MRTFDTFEPGKNLGQIVLRHDPARLGTWNRMFPDSREAHPDSLPAGYILAAFMRGYLAIIGDRPPGNVHAGQTLNWHRSVPYGADLVVDLTCRDKNLKDDRRWVWFTVTVAQIGAGPCLSGDMRMLWAK